MVMRRGGLLLQVTPVHLQKLLLELVLLLHEESAPKGSLVMRDLNDKRVWRSRSMVCMELAVDGRKRRPMVVVRRRGSHGHCLLSMALE